MTIAEEIHDALLDASNEKPFNVDSINEILECRLYDMLCKADSALSAIRHGRSLTDAELEAVYFPIRDVCDDMKKKSSY